MHDGVITPVFKQRWDAGDEDWVWVAWDDLVRGASLSFSEWLLPDGWEVRGENHAAMVTDDVSGRSFSVANAVLLSVAPVEGLYQLVNRVEFDDGRKYQRGVGIEVVRSQVAPPLL